MAEFKTAVLTKQGLALNAKVQAGLTNINFVRVETGAGSYSDSDTIMNRIALKDRRQEFAFDSIRVGENNNTSILTFTVSNWQGDDNYLETGYAWTETGIIATDPDDGEILYAIAVAVRDREDYIPAYNGMLPYTNVTDFITEVANAETVTIELVEGVYITAEGARMLIEQHNMDPTSHPDIRLMLDDINSRLRLIELMFYTDVSGNPFTVTFPNLDDVDVTGRWNKPMMRVEF